MPQESTPQSRVPPPELSERILRSWYRFGSEDVGDAGHSALSACRVKSGGHVLAASGSIGALFREGGEHRLNVRLPEPRLVNGITSRLRLEGWDSIRYLAFGYTSNGQFRHVKVPNPPLARWFNVTLAHGDISYGLQNGWIHPEAEVIDEVRIEVRGIPCAAGGRAELGDLICWDEESKVSERPTTCSRPLVLPTRRAVPAGWFDAIRTYLSKAFPKAEEQAKDCLITGRCPLMGDAMHGWPPDAMEPVGLASVNTHRFSWHALHPVLILLMYARVHGNIAAVYPARELVTRWLDRGYYASPPEGGYAWYDHGVADRLLALLLAWSEGVEREFDWRFMTRVGEAIVRHAQLLESESFYAANQGIRYHNHACIQDLALLAAGTALPEFPGAARWRDRACERLVEQMEAMAVREAGFAVCIENSSSYHEGLRGLMAGCGALAKLAGTRSLAADFADELSAFSRLLRYPDGRAPANGDSKRSVAQSRGTLRGRSAPVPPAFVVLPQAGYGVVRGRHDDAPFMICMFGTSICKTHKHADDLSFTLFFDGIEWLIDPSYFSYEITQPLSAYLRSPAAHNMVHVPGLPYSIEPGLVRLHGSSGSGTFRLGGSHRCHPGTTVSRTVEGSMDELSLRFVDCVQGADGISEAALMLHCREGVMARQEGTRVVLSHPWSSFALEITLPSDRIEIVMGEESESRIRGVAGQGFLEKSAVVTVECTVPVGREIPWTMRAVPATGRCDDLATAEAMERDDADSRGIAAS